MASPHLSKSDTSTCSTASSVLIHATAVPKNNMANEKQHDTSGMNSFPLLSLRWGGGGW